MSEVRRTRTSEQGSGLESRRSPGESASDARDDSPQRRLGQDEHGLEREPGSRARAERGEGLLRGGREAGSKDVEVDRLGGGGRGWGRRGRG